jgi:excinuclease ABC subunit C
VGTSQLRAARDYPTPDNYLVFRLTPGWWRDPALREVWQIPKPKSNKILKMTKKLEAKLSQLPSKPGVYFHKNAKGEIIYIGKAANLRNRVRQYFQKSRTRDPKTDLLISEINDVEWTELESEADALFLEAELVKRYLPPYNILLRDDKSQLYVRIDYKSDYPTVTSVRRPLDDGAEYFGPYLNGFALRKALRFLRRAFPYAISKPVNQKRASLHYHLGLDPGLEDGRTNLSDYRANLRKLMQYLRGERVALMRSIEAEMKKAAKAQDFEKAAVLRNQLSALNSLNRQTIFGDREIMDASRDQALVELCGLLGLPQPPRRIEGFDISHLQGTDTVASMVVFINGLPDKASYRKFKMRLLGNDDFAHMSETITRRLRGENLKKWGIGDLMLIDGGKGQLWAAVKARDQMAKTIPVVGLAKRQEAIIVHKSQSLVGPDSQKIINQAKAMGAYVSESDDFITIELPKNSHILKLLQRIRDESHRFAVSYHSTLARSRQTTSLLDEVPGLGPQTRQKLIRHFGSARAALNADSRQLQELLGHKKGQQMAKFFAQIR